MVLSEAKDDIVTSKGLLSGMQPRWTRKTSKITFFSYIRWTWPYSRSAAEEIRRLLGHVGRVAWMMCQEASGGASALCPQQMRLRRQRGLAVGRGKSILNPASSLPHRRFSSGAAFLVDQLAVLNLQSCLFIWLHP